MGFYMRCVVMIMLTNLNKCKKIINRGYTDELTTALSGIRRKQAHQRERLQALVNAGKKGEHQRVCTPRFERYQKLLLAASDAAKKQMKEGIEHYFKNTDCETCKGVRKQKNHFLTKYLNL